MSKLELYNDGRAFVNITQVNLPVDISTDVERFSAEKLLVTEILLNFGFG